MAAGFCRSPRSLRAGGGGSTIPGLRRRRWFDVPQGEQQDQSGLSAQAEVVRPQRNPKRRRSRSLRAGGGGSSPTMTPMASAPVSPRRRRWFARGQPGAAAVGGLSAQAEVVRSVSQLASAF